MSCQVRHQSDQTNFLLFVGRATQRGQGETHGGNQVEGCYVSQTQQGEGSVTPAPTASHVVLAQLYRHVDVGVQHLVGVQDPSLEEDVLEEKE